MFVCANYWIVPKTYRVPKESEKVINCSFRTTLIRDAGYVVRPPFGKLDSLRIEKNIYSVRTISVTPSPRTFNAPALRQHALGTCLPTKQSPVMTVTLPTASKNDLPDDEERITYWHMDAVYGNLHFKCLRSFARSYKLQ